MTVWERIECLADEEPTVLFQNWGPNLDGASLVTALIKVNGRDVAIYGHDFTVRAGSMDATNGKKLARLFELAAKRKIPLVVTYHPAYLLRSPGEKGKVWEDMKKILQRLEEPSE